MIVSWDLSLALYFSPGNLYCETEKVVRGVIKEMEINKVGFRIMNLKYWREKQNADSGVGRGRGILVGN